MIKRTDQELHEQLQHKEWLKRWEAGIVAEDPPILKMAMLAVLVGAVVTIAVYAISAALR